MKNKALLIFNPKSGEQKMTLEELLERVHLHLEAFEISDFEISGEDVAMRLSDSISQIKPDLVIIAGGDGTIKLTSECLNEKATLSILPLGSANGFARCLNICNLEDGLNALKKLDTLQVDAIQIGEEVCLHLADFGANANLIHNFEKGDFRGMLGYVTGSLSEVFSLKSNRFRIEMPDETVQSEAVMLVIANGTTYGTGAIINPDGKLNDGKFEIIAVTVDSTAEFILVTKRMFTGESFDPSNIKTWSVESCKIFNLDQAKFQIDGEVRDNLESVEIKINKAAFEFVRKS